MQNKQYHFSEMLSRTQFNDQEPDADVKGKLNSIRHCPTSLTIMSKTHHVALNFPAITLHLNAINGSVVITSNNNNTCYDISFIEISQNLLATKIKFSNLCGDLFI